MNQLTDPNTPTPALADELFAVVDVLDAEPGLRNALSDPTASAEVRRQLAADVFGPRVSGSAAAVIDEVAGSRWASAGALSDALERQAVRVVFDVAQRADRLDEVEDELFRFGRIVAGDEALRTALEDHRVALAAREQLVRDLLGDKVDPLALRLAVRAVAARDRTYTGTIDEMLALAAQVHGRAIAHVTVAAPLTEDQTARLRRTLAAQAGLPVTLEVVVDPAVLGGVRVRLGDELIDGTVSGRLEAAKRQLNR